MEKVYESFQEYDIISVFGAGGDRDRTKRPLMGQVAAKYSKEIIITSDNPRFEDPDQICNDILVGCKEMKHLEIELNRKVAIAKGLEKAKKYSNPVLLILGKGDEETQIIYDKKLPLSDKKIVEELLKETFK